ncbi:MAG: hypothetical protein GX621_02535, partial [Pirellulaceae bacterium]|nr:hypothetical protein [Pirellulaceae bacterium]
EFNGLLYFVADDGVNGEELWQSDGTTVGTVMVKDINPGQGNQYPYGFGILSSFPRDLTVIDGVLYFSAEDNTHGAELWRSDGTAAGTVMVKDIFSGTFTDSYGTYPNSSNPANLVNVGGTLFFTAYDDDHGWELWTSDGTESGTRLVKDIFTGTFTDTDGTYPNSSTPSQLTDVDGVLYFVADDGTHGLELWKSDGTEAGTTMVEDIRAGTGDAFGERIELIAMNGILYFAADNGIVGDELWRSDGTTEGTYLLKDVKTGSEGNLSYFTGFTVVDDHLFFSADDGTHGRELWKTDGTEQGTALVADIALGTSSSYPFYMTAVDGILYFSA